MKFGFIAKHRGIWPAGWLCEALGVSRGGLCRKEGINQNLYYRWSKEFLEAGKKRLAGDTAALSEQIYTDAIGF